MGARYREVVEGPRGRPGVKAEDFDWLSSDQDVIATAKPPQNLLNFSSMGTWSKVARYVGGSLEAMQRCDVVLDFVVRLPLMVCMGPLAQQHSSCFTNKVSAPRNILTPRPPLR